jgi:hypothetical protein
MKYYRITKDGTEEELIFDVEECILKGTIRQTGEKTKIVMDKYRFEEWRMRMRCGK